mmetsp:Transcript_23985/g.36821  ORF Transcript_23985/g.36821 Transcript_23985/m.36821 type:complete len:85 (+) Transcript_23985:2124-2378(+)
MLQKAILTPHRTPKFDGSKNKHVEAALRGQFREATSGAATGDAKGSRAGHEPPSVKFAVVAESSKPTETTQSKVSKPETVEKKG